MTYYIASVSYLENLMKNYIFHFIPYQLSKNIFCLILFFDNLVMFLNTEANLTFYFENMTSLILLTIKGIKMLAFVHSCAFLAGLEGKREKDRNKVDLGFF